MKAERLLSMGALVACLVLILSQPVQPLDSQPWPDAISYVGLSDQLTGPYEVELWTDHSEGRYPPGLPLVLATTDMVGLSPQHTAILLTAGLMVAAWALAGRLGGSVAAAFAVVALVGSRELRGHAGLVMSDIPTALVTVLACWAVVAGRDRLAGLLAGWAAWVRLAGVVTVAGLRRRAWVPFALVLAGLGVAKVLLGFGYPGDRAGWSVSHLWSGAGIEAPEVRGGNLWAYSTMLVGVGGTLTLPGVLLLGAWGAWNAPGGRWALSVSAATLAVYLPYFGQDERFMFPVLALGCVYAGVWVASRVGGVIEGEQVGAGGDGMEARRPVAR